jgi:hypothetical protein
VLRGYDDYVIDELLAPKGERQQMYRSVAAEKQRIVEVTCVPGVSVAQVAHFWQWPPEPSSIDGSR